jgi:hypothetical protein
MPHSKHQSYDGMRAEEEALSTSTHSEEIACRDLIARQQSFSPDVETPRTAEVKERQVAGGLSLYAKRNEQGAEFTMSSLTGAKKSSSLPRMQASHSRHAVERSSTSWTKSGLGSNQPTSESATFGHSS